VSVFAGLSVPASTSSAPSCSRRSRDFSCAGKDGLSSTEEKTDSLPVGPRCLSLSVPEDLALIISRSSARTRYVGVSVEVD